MEQDGNGSINPINWDVVYTTISATRPFIYVIRGEIEVIDESRIFLDMTTAMYYLQKGEPYYFYLEYLDEKSEKIKIVFQ